MVRHYLNAGLILLTSTWLVGACATSDPDADREQFLAAERALMRGDTSTFERLRTELEDYPLYPYLEYERLSRELHRVDTDELDAFFEQYADTPLANRLRQEWLNLLVRRGDWDDFISYYEEGLGTRLDCRYGWALYKAEQREAAFEQAERLWQVGRSQPDACDPLFHAWRQADQLTSDLAWQRVELAMEADKVSLARYLRRYLSSQDKVWFDRWREVRNRPESILAADWAAPEVDAKRSPPIVEDAFRRMAARDAAEAWDRWQAFRERHDADATDYVKIGARIALLMALRHDPDADDVLDAVDEQAWTRQLAAWRIRIALLDEDWDAVIDHIRELPADHRDETRWQYWLARALEATDATSEAEAVYRRIAERQEYYAFLAQDRLGQDYEVDYQPIAADEASDLPERVDGIRRAVELYELERDVEARREWTLALEQMDGDDLSHSAAIAAELGWHDQAILALARSGDFRELGLRYPLIHRSEITRKAESRTLNPALVYAVIRQESAFREKARSRAGALGLMQIMPATGRYIANALDEPYRGPASLLDAERNLRFGTAYLQEQLNAHEDQPALALAAYNAGPHRVEQWRPKDGWLDADIWVETIPFAETRQYIQRTLTHLVIYEDRLGLDPQPLSERMPPVAPRGYIHQADATSAGDQ